MLCIPAGIFTFLKFFGDNRFDVEIFHQDGISVDGCASYKGPYQLPDSLLDNKPSINSILIIADKENAVTIKNTVSRLQDLFQSRINITAFASSQVNEAYYKQNNDLLFLKQCLLFMDDPNMMALVDKENRIRGYYSLELDEIDRLIVETKILLENDERNKR